MAEDNEKQITDPIESDISRRADKAIDAAKKEFAEKHKKLMGPVYMGPPTGKPPSTLLTGALKLKERIEEIERTAAEIAVIDSGDKTVN